ncbi:MAG TPA: hypothetical protein VFF12_18650 [Myxococcaceae bacterium]|nr:hypothetical protein [Myxococcaceae bacterium]
MTSLAIASIIFVCVFSGVLTGMFIRRALPGHHVTKETEDVVRLGMAIIATLSALVIGLLIASAKSGFDTKDNEIRQFAADLILLDRQLVHYGPEMTDARDLLRRYISFAVNSTWPREASQPPRDSRGWMLLEDIQIRLRRLAPHDDAQRALQARALQISGDLARTRWLLDVERGGSISTPFLVVVVFWLTVIFTSFGLFAPRNATAVVALALCSLSIAGSMYLILEMDRPFNGLIHISSAPMREALAQVQP